MQARTWALAGAAAAVVAAAGGFAVWQWFWPEGSTHASESLPEEYQAAVVVSTGTFRGGDAIHHTGGSVSLLRGSDGSLLRFENYSQTDGPDVWAYLTESDMPDGTADVEGAGVRLHVPGGAEGGRSTVRGTFNVPIPADVDVEKYSAVAIWCDRFNTLFGYAPLAPP